MKLRTEILPDEEEEIIIRAKKRDDKIRQIELSLENILGLEGDMILEIDNTEYYVPKKDILFFETSNGKVSAHTASNMYYTDHKLYELEAMLPNYFMRVSKSCILNVLRINSISRNLAGASRVTFYDSDKAVYVSRSYYKPLKERIYNLRFSTD